MLFRREILSILLAFLMISVFVPGTSAEDNSQEFSPDSPAGIIRSYADKAVSTLNDTNLTDIDNTDPLRKELSGQLAPIVNFELMTRSALGPQARQINQDQLNELTNVFQPLVIRLYISRLVEYMVDKDNPWRLDRIEVHDQEIRGNGRFALVSGSAHVYREENHRSLSMNFRMIKEDDQWLVYDLEFENVSLVENYRSQFTSVLSNNSVDYLVKQLNKKLDEIKSSDQNKKSVNIK